MAAAPALIMFDELSHVLSCGVAVAPGLLREPKVSRKSLLVLGELVDMGPAPRTGECYQKFRLQSQFD